MTPGIENDFEPLDLNQRCSLWVLDSNDDGVIDVVHCDNDVFGNNILISDIPKVIGWLDAVYKKYGV